MPSQRHVLLPGSQRRIAHGARATGRADAHEWVELTIKVRRRSPAPELIARPDAPLTRRALAARHGATDTDLARVTRALKHHGLDTLGSHPAARSLRVAGTAEAIEKCFDVRLMRFGGARGVYRGRVGAVRVPAELAGIVTGVFGLDDRPMVRTVRPSRRRRAIAVPQASARAWFLASELAAIYDFPDGDGAGETVAILEFGGGYFPADLASYCQQAKVPPPVVEAIGVHGAPTNAKDGAEDEVMLDVEVVAGVCPRAKLAVYFSRFTEQGWIDAIDAAVHDDARKPSVVSVSWGWAEDDDWSAGAIDAIHETLHDAALLGVTVCVASGDDGSADGIEDGHAHVDFPASSPYALAVGGTTLHVRAGIPREQAWKEGDGLRSDGGGASGGGVSVHFARPAWQKVKLASVNPGAIDGRVLPDVAADASATTGYFVVVDGQGGVIGGTSAAAPLWAALVARVNAKLPAGKRTGWLTPLLYGAGAGGRALGAGVCRDITSGDNISATIGGYRARAGFDAVTGWGVPKGRALLAAMQKL
ncbi:MAG TPA: S53 family peptidase [Candidatus Acidoferrales bacterium]|nr:S53 family peptidase [Candidatus Acidoferrales bacterium]